MLSHMHEFSVVRYNTLKNARATVLFELKVLPEKEYKIMYLLTFCRNAGNQKHHDQFFQFTFAIVYPLLSFLIPK